jgi:hypothetical protein
MNTIVMVLLNEDKKGKEQYGLSPGFFYSLTFRFAREEGKRLIRFNDTNLKQSFDVRIGGGSIGVIDFVYPFEMDKSNNTYEFTIDLPESDADKIKELLSPFSGKVIWE